MVLTIEPGLYLIDSLLAPYRGDTRFCWEKIDALRPFGGIRIEDNVHITPSGNENLTRDAFAEMGVA